MAVGAEEEWVAYAKLKGKRVWQTVTNLWGVCKEKGVKERRGIWQTEWEKRDKQEEVGNVQCSRRS